MGKLSIYVINEVLDHVLKTGSFTPPTHLYIALFDGDPSGAGTECPGTEYARVVCDTWDAAAARKTANTSQIDFAECETADWGNITYIAIYDAISGGNLIGYDDIASYTVEIGDNLYIAAGDIDVEFSAGGVCNSFAASILDHIFKTSALTIPTDLYIGVSTANPGDDNSGIAEPSGNAYARIKQNTWNAAAAKVAENDGIVTFVQATGSWGTLTHWFMADHLTEAGEPHIIFYGALGESAIIGNGDTLKLSDEGIDIKVDAA